MCGYLSWSSTSCVTILCGPQVVSLKLEQVALQGNLAVLSHIMRRCAPHIAAVCYAQ